MNLPRLVIAAPASGSGKTTVAIGLMAAFAERGLAVSPHKVGPDYIDPGYHAMATGRPGRNLDAHLCGPGMLPPLLRHGARGCDLAVIEGVMGLFDGASGRGAFASTAHVATVLSAPVVLVVDASAQARSIAALVYGFARYDPAVRLGGVIVNRVGSAAHEHLLREALLPLGIPVLGALPRREDVASPSRHLGLVPVAEREIAARRVIRAAAEVVRHGCDLDRILALARSAPPLHHPPWDPGDAVAADGDRPGRGAVVAVASGAAFTFGYQENVELLSAAGAEVVAFDPLRDRALPERTAGLVLGGGFPETYAADLSANRSLRHQVSTLAAGGAPVAAECGGLLYLGRSLDGHPMCGVLDVEARMTDRLTLGYRHAVAAADSPLTLRGSEVRGHEFHRTATSPGHGERPAWKVRDRGPEGFVAGGVHASYLHLHWAAHPGIARRFAAAAARATRPRDGGTRTGPAAGAVDAADTRDDDGSDTLSGTVSGTVSGTMSGTVSDAVGGTPYDTMDKTTYKVRGART